MPRKPEFYQINKHIDTYQRKERKRKKARQEKEEPMEV